MKLKRSYLAAFKNPQCCPDYWALFHTEVPSLSQMLVSLPELRHLARLPATCDISSDVGSANRQNSALVLTDQVDMIKQLLVF
jgi:hypothetical protein